MRECLKWAYHLGPGSNSNNWVSKIEFKLKTLSSNSNSQIWVQTHKFEFKLKTLSLSSKKELSLNSKIWVQTQTQWFEFKLKGKISVWVQTQNSLGKFLSLSLSLNTWTGP